MSPPILLLAFAAALQEPATAPFDLELPAGYQAFAAAPNESGESFEALAVEGELAGRFAVHAWLLASPGARADLVAANQRQQFWPQQLRNVPHELAPWEGTWAGHSCAGTIIEYTRERTRRVALERVLAIDDRLVIATWEGPQSQAGDATAALDSFVLPAVWTPDPVPEVDAARGLDAGARVLPSPGRLRIRFDYGGAALESFVVEIDFEPDADLPWDAAIVFHPPPHAEILAGAEALADGRWSAPRAQDGRVLLRYALPLDRNEETVGALAASAARHGLMVGYARIAALDPLWIAAPEYPGEMAAARGTPTPPAWSLELLLPANLGALSWAPPVENELLATGARRLLFPELPAGAAWPFFLAGTYSSKSYAGRVTHLGAGVRAHNQGEVVRFLHAISDGLADWLPQTTRGSTAAADWSMATFSGVLDRALPGLMVLDDTQGWLVNSLDGPWMGASRRAGLAQRVAARAFGMQLRGVGPGAVFLEPALAEYGAWRLLQAGGHAADADALLAAWQRADRAAGELPRPLTLMPAADLTMGRRLLTRGPLVWVAIERRAGRSALDQVLRGALEHGRTWSTEDLRLALEARTGDDWSAFFDAYVYGRQEPPAAGGR